MNVLVPSSFRELRHAIQDSPTAVVFPTVTPKDMASHLSAAMKELGVPGSTVIVWDINKICPRPNDPVECHVPYFYSNGTKVGKAVLTPRLTSSQAADTIVALASELATKPVPLHAPHF